MSMRHGFHSTRHLQPWNQRLPSSRWMCHRTTRNICQHHRCRRSNTMPHWSISTIQRTNILYTMPKRLCHYLYRSKRLYHVSTRNRNHRQQTMHQLQCRNLFQTRNMYFLSHRTLRRPRSSTDMQRMSRRYTTTIGRSNAMQRMPSRYLRCHHWFGHLPTDTRWIRLV